MNQNTKRLVLLNLPYVLMGLYATNLGYVWRLAVGADFSEKMMSLMGVLPGALGRIVPSFHPLDLAVGLCCGVGLRLAVYLKGKNAKKYRHGSEYGSARWGNAKDIEPYVAPKFEDNIGKTRFWIKPNLLQMHSSYVLTDPKGTTVLEVGNAFLKKGYCIKIFNTINFKKSMRYNPFHYIHSEKDILKLVTTLMTNTRGEGKGGDPFWDKAEKLLLTSLIAYITTRPQLRSKTSPPCWNFSTSWKSGKMTRSFKTRWTSCLRTWQKRNPITSQCGNTVFISWRRARPQSRF